MSDCPCHSGRSYPDCCGPLHEGSRLASSPEELMRARYCAFARSEIDFLAASHDPDVREEFDPDSARQWSEGATWHGFEVLRTEAGGAGDTTGVVEFVAHYSVNDSPVEHHEVSEFRKVGDQWFFVDGKEVPTTVRRDQPKVGRNDPCPCGSGKKHKKCCGR